MTPRRGRPSERIMTENAGRRTDLRGQARLVSPRRQRESDLCDRPASEGSPLPASAGAARPAMGSSRAVSLAACLQGIGRLEARRQS